MIRIKKEASLVDKADALLLAKFSIAEGSWQGLLIGKGSD